MGCWAIGGEWDFLGSPAGWGATDDAESLRALQAAYDAGVRVFDTAANYGAGLSERLVGQVLRPCRDQCIITTKFGYKVDEDAKSVSTYGDESTSDVVRHLQDDCESSLRRLGIDYVDVYFFHINRYDLELAFGVRERLERLVEQGKIRYYGWSTDDVASARLFSEGEHCAA
jgi:aryl-alcohol dehydrogenase-like predicted oxidoreductase